MCGARVETKKVAPQEPIQYEENQFYENKANDQIIIQPKKKLSKGALSAIIIIPVMIGLIILPFAAISIIGSINTPLGSLEYEVTSLEALDTKLVIDNSVGSVAIYYDNSITGLFKASIEVYGGIKATLDDAVNFEHQIINNQTIISFNSDIWFDSFWTMKQLSYEIIVQLNPNAMVDFDIVTSTGSSALHLNGLDNIEIQDLKLDSSTGSINVISEQTINTTIQDITLTTSTGSITFDFNEAINTQVKDIYIECSTGRVAAFLGENMLIDSYDVFIHTSTGSVILDYQNIILMNNVDLDLSTSTGSISVNINQNIINPTNFTAYFDIETSTGSITVDCNTNLDIGIEMQADTSTGSINLPGGFSHYISPDCYLKHNIYYFTLITSTGSITAEINS